MVAGFTYFSLLPEVAKLEDPPPPQNYIGGSPPPSKLHCRIPPQKKKGEKEGGRKGKGKIN